MAYQQLTWISISFGSSLIISLVLPFYIALPLIIAVFSSISFIRNRQILRRTPIRGIMGRTEEEFGGVGTKYRCIACGSFVRGSACYNCGSKMKKAEF
ncbi:MAG: hypothetical protein ACJ71K_21430 [Nitrososphaeraceae archaeon]